MRKIYIERIGSTQLFLKEKIRNEGYSEQIIVFSHHQTDGIGSRNNSWKGVEGNFYFSFAIHKEELPNDLHIASASIYFSYLLKEILEDKGSQVWIKWPNDFYLKNKKIGGTITTLVGDVLICGIGLNTQKVNKNFGILDIVIKLEDLIEGYSEIIKNTKSWSSIFSKFRIEFDKSKRFKSTINNHSMALFDALLLEDGALIIDGKKVYSLR